MSGVDGRVIVVTGAGGGLGREYALSLAARGAQVVVNDLGGARDGSGKGSAMADDVVAEIREAGGQAAANYDSVATPEGADSLIRSAVHTFGAVHGIVSNAGILRDASFGKLSEENWDAVLKVHLYGGFHVTRAAWPYFREQRFGRIVLVTSTSGIYGAFGQANYGAAKAGLIGLANTLAVEGAGRNILTNAIAPLAATRMTSDQASEEVLAGLSPAFVAPVVGQLLREESVENGNVYVVGGGLVQRVQQFQNAGVRFDAPPTSDQIAAQWSAINDMSAPIPGADPRE